jgi:hypothetical protein
MLSRRGRTHCGTGVPSPLSPPVVGNGRAVACNSSLAWYGVSVGWADSISPTVPATSGTEKLVPSDAL